MDAIDKAITEVRAVREHDEMLLKEEVLCAGDDIGTRLTQPVRLTWAPKPDITAYELAKLLPLFLWHQMIMPYDLPQDERLLRHLIVDDPNK